MTEIKNIRILLEYYFNNFKDEYAIATSVLMYVDTSSEFAIKKEIEKRVDLFDNKDIDIKDKCEKVFNILEDIKENIGLNFGKNEQILYNENKFTSSFKLLSDFCKGASIINSAYSKEYIDMTGKGYKRMLSQLLTKINNNLIEVIIEKKNNNLDSIVKSETDYISNMKSNKTNNGIKLLNYHASIERDRKEYIENEIKKINNDNKIIGEAIGCFLLNYHKTYEFEIDHYTELIKHLRKNIEPKERTEFEGVIQASDYAISYWATNFDKIKSEEQKINDEFESWNLKSFLSSVVAGKLLTQKNIDELTFISELRFINNNNGQEMNSIEVKKIFDKAMEEKQKIKQKVKVKEPEILKEIEKKEEKIGFIKRGINWFYK